LFNPGDIISYLDMCKAEGMNLQRGMNFRPSGRTSVILMNVSLNAPYSDRIEEEGRILVYEGHDIPKVEGVKDTKSVDQQLISPSGNPNQNGLFYKSAEEYKKRRSTPENVKVYEKIRPGIWVFNGMFRLIDAWRERVGERHVFKFKLELGDADSNELTDPRSELEHTRVIPTSVKLKVWERDKGKCVICAKEDNLHFDHIIPFSKGGSSLVAENIQLLCARHNLKKHDRIE
jgi:hypothetical protein